MDMLCLHDHQRANLLYKTEAHYEAELTLADSYKAIFNMNDHCEFNVCFHADNTNDT